MTSDFGSCFANGTCDGLSGLLAENKVDFGIFPVDINYGPDVPVNSTVPFVRGPVCHTVSMTVQSLPWQKEQISEIDILQIYRDTSIFVVSLLIFFFFEFQ